MGCFLRWTNEFHWSCVKSVGRDAIMVDASSAAIPRAEGESLIRLDMLRNTQVVGDNGELAGTHCRRIRIAGNINIVTAPEGGGLFHQAPRFRVEPAAIQAIGPKLITINASTVNFQSES